MSTDAFDMTSRRIDVYAELSGDFNPLHVDEAFAAETEFGRRIAHGPIAFTVALRDIVGDRGWVEGMRVDTKYVAPVGVGDDVSWRWSNSDQTEFEVLRDDDVVAIVGSVER